MTTAGGVLFSAVLLATLLWWRAGRNRRREAARKARREADRQALERRREAHYMQNFWSYDGSAQEEFRG